MLSVKKQLTFELGRERAEQTHPVPGPNSFGVSCAYCVNQNKYILKEWIALLARSALIGSEHLERD